MNVLSLFDGASCGQVALQRAGIHYDNYFASEIDKYAVHICMKNHPGTIQVGDVEKLHFRGGFLISEKGAKYVGRIDLLMGGSPCQSFSNVGDGSGFDGKSKLFWQYVRLLREIRAENPDVKFLLENVKMKEAWKDIISGQLGVVPVEINSARVSGQNRERLYWANFGPLAQPGNRGIRLSDVLEADVPARYTHAEAALAYMGRKVKGGRSHWDFAHHSDSKNEKSACLVANLYKGVPYNVLIDGSRIRKFTPMEAERLQTLPDNYTEGVSETQRFKMIGNGWTVDVIAHILNHLD